MNLLIKDVRVPDGDKTAITSIYITDGVIAAIGNAPDGFIADETIDGNGKLAIPAFINAHTHDYMTILRGVADDLPFMEWLFGGVIPREDKMTRDQAYWSSLLGCVEMIKRGTGTFCDMHMFGGVSAKAAIDCGMRAVLGRGLVGTEGGQLRLDEHYAEMDQFGGNENISFILAPHAIYTCDKEFLLTVRGEAEKSGLGINIHLAESITEFNDCVRDNGCTPTEYLYNLGLLTNKTLAAHCVQLTERDIELLAKCGVSVASNPKSNLKLGNGIAPIYELDKAGVNVCLGTDSTASNNSLNMFSELNYCALLQKGKNGDSTAIPASRAFEFATVNGAKALGIEKLGKLEAGWKADITLLDLNQPQFIPFRDPYSMVCYCADGSETDTVIIGGKVVLRNKKMVNIDEDELYYNVRKIAEDF